ncbi:sigma-70 family RNA polymerase sigma factor [Paenibacillus alba]|uniref:Sigma-70 family RNA polymerase sigma factor n=1 Tax=Paenibacillus alba TaxID=1197127 RepID=A0ABU6FX77_9BACL|nr:sigma-70 family RNA polymerase sigma factor [Paenibacillus alba]MEC0226511.1 sigma-70 family RNA polymerase sigma factor [Paenibacillus alba]
MLEQWVRQAQSGDQDAFVRFVREVEQTLYAVARAMLNSDEDCADAIQEAILKAYRSLGALQEPAYAKTWFTRIVINECNRILNNRKKVVTLQKINSYRDQLDEDYKGIELREIVDQLEQPLRTLIILYYYEDMSLSQIADLLEIPEGTVKSRLHRARAELADLLNRPEERSTCHE